MPVMPFDEVPCRADWLTVTRYDPATGLVAFPDLYPVALAEALHTAAATSKALGVAIGDVDDLSVHMERVNASDPDSFGHLAGATVMAQLGQVARAWFAEAVPSGCVATFGGDEVIVVATGLTHQRFTDAINDLRDRCTAELPCTVSFATAVVEPDLLWPTRDPVRQGKLLLARLDRALFDAKAARHAVGGPGGSVVQVDSNEVVCDAA
ncbi:GGDEF domain-containing protein [Nocardia sp. NPDC060249]|uniref:GGDEF domain-containing protein n=1 Tax=Nocardia sp. NPDC060249 TaxID=3347082 RepID=UPI00365A1E8D